MPWSVSDVDEHKKGLTPAQKKKWVSIANGVYRECMKDGDDKTCAAKAIRIANSKFEEAEMPGKLQKKEVPTGALHLMEAGLESDCHLVFEEKDGKKVPKLNMVAYSGGIIKNHFWWGNLGIDLSGMQFPKSKYPILDTHQTDKRIGFTGKPIADTALKIDPEKTVFLDNEYSQRFQEDSAKGFPFQSSIYAQPTAIERVEDGETVEVNGHKLKGPGTVWRKSIFKEASVVVFGYDSETSATAFSKDIKEEIEYTEKGGDVGSSTESSLQETEETRKEVKELDLEKLKKDHPDLYNQVFEEGKKAGEQAAADQLKAKDTEIAKLQADNSTQASQLSQQGEEIAQLKKSDALRTEREMKVEADRIFDAKFSASDVPDRMKEKVRSMPPCNHDKFVKDGVFDQQAFGESVEKELKDWEEKGATGTVMGTGTSSRSEFSSRASAEQKAAEEGEKAGDDLLALAGQPQNKS